MRSFVRSFAYYHLKELGDNDASPLSSDAVRLTPALVNDDRKLEAFMLGGGMFGFVPLLFPAPASGGAGMTEFILAAPMRAAALRLFCPVKELRNRELLIIAICAF